MFNIGFISDFKEGGVQRLTFEGPKNFVTISRGTNSHVILFRFVEVEIKKEKGKL